MNSLKDYTVGPPYPANIFLSGRMEERPPVKIYYCFENALAEQSKLLTDRKEDDERNAYGNTKDHPT